MHTSNKNRSPIILGNKISRNLSNRSEVLDDVRLDKQRKIGGGKIVGLMAGRRSRPPLSIVNSQAENNDAELIDKYPLCIRGIWERRVISLWRYTRRCGGGVQEGGEPIDMKQFAHLRSPE
ncbi:hypothetical protein KFK09_013604 [Dendrobium nobile]|uniref:Uncharacterized protein n=1 Tax=Dendrobium nobile TaxID=94219 RepID=A0A8T3BDH7_DENNO|nr:hypothetical protein KFK09_013604 [Dendrobium nobile]